MQYQSQTFHVGRLFTTLSTIVASIVVLLSMTNLVGGQEAPDVVNPLSEQMGEVPTSALNQEMWSPNRSSIAFQEENPYEDFPEVKQIMTGLPLPGETVQFTTIISSTGVETPIQFSHGVSNSVVFLPETFTITSPTLNYTVTDLIVSTAPYTLSVGEVLKVKTEHLLKPSLPRQGGRLYG